MSWSTKTGILADYRYRYSNCMITDFSDKYARSSITETGDVLQLQHEECMIVDYYERYCTVCMVVDYNGKYV